MTRINKLVNDLVFFREPVKVFVDIGSGNGVVASQQKWVSLAESKYSVEKDAVDSCLDSSWRFVESIDKIQKSIDLVTMMDVIEHFEKNDGLFYLDKIERLSRHIVLFTPRGFLRQDGQTHPEYRDHPLMHHRSGWTEGDFLERGYSVRILHRFHNPKGINGLFDGLLCWR